MLVKDITFETPQENILYDEVLLKLAEDGQQAEALRFWESQVYFVVLGRIGKAQDDVHLKAAAKDGVKVLRRASGGGTVLQGPGCLNYSLILARENSEVNDLKRSYQLILGKVVNALRHQGIESSFFPISDIALKKNNRKVSGNAQKRGRKFILHHGTLLIDFDLDLIGRYLKMPKETPAYRQERSHQDFIANAGIEREAFKKALADEFRAAQRAPLSAGEEGLLKELLRTREVFDEQENNA